MGVKTIGNCYYKWTQSALECYERQCKKLGCNGCYYNEFFTKSANYTQKCKMQTSIIVLIRNVGLPTQKDYDSIERGYNDY